MFILDVEKLKSSDLVDRILGFWEAYDNYFETSHVPFLELCIQNGNYYLLYYSLRCIQMPYVSLSYLDFSSMDSTTFLCWAEHARRTVALLDEQSALYCELISDYSL